MNSENPIGIIELGNINLRCLIFRIDRDNKAEILYHSYDEIWRDMVVYCMLNVNVEYNISFCTK